MGKGRSSSADGAAGGGAVDELDHDGGALGVRLGVDLVGDLLEFGVGVDDLAEAGNKAGWPLTSRRVPDTIRHIRPVVG